MIALARVGKIRVILISNRMIENSKQQVKAKLSTNKRLGKDTVTTKHLFLAILILT